MERPTVKATVVLLTDSEGRIVLARKKQAIHHDNGEIGYSLKKYNGYGGKMEPGDETIFDTAIRELIDESGVHANKEDLELVSRAYFYVPAEEGYIPFMDVSFFLLRKWEGEPAEGEEMGPPEYFPKDELPSEMMPADKPLFEKFFAGERKVFQVMLPGKDKVPKIIELEEALI